MKRIFGIALAAAALTACEPHVGIAKPSDTYLRCADEPAVPDGAGPTGEITDDQDTSYKMGLRGAWQDCRSKVDYLREWFDKLPD